VADIRTGKRFPVELPIRIHVSNSDQERAGTTANISAAGVYLKADAVTLQQALALQKERKRGSARGAQSAGAGKPAEITLMAGSEEGQALRCGAVVEFDMTLPAAAIGAAEDVHIQCRGRVMRIEQPTAGDARNGVACVIDKYEFVRKA
jgi:hypothetical protein